MSHQLGSQRRHITKRLSLQLGHSFCLVERMDVSALVSLAFGHHYLMSFASSLYFLHDRPLSVCPGRFQTWELVFVLS